MWILVVGAFVIYGLIGLLAYRPILPGESSHMPSCACGDPALQVWFLRWVPYAISHAQNPLFTDWTNYPIGVNLAQNTEMPLLALLTAPLTVLVSPVASYNLLLWLAFPASATAMFFVTKRWTGSTVAALIAGLLYGFSAYVVGQAVGHVMLSFVPLPPLFFYQLRKIVARSTGHPYRDGLVLGVIAILQFFIESELLATLALVGLSGLLLLAISNWRSITGDDTAYVARSLACGSLLIAVAIAYPFWVLKFGSQHVNGPLNLPNNPYHSSLLSPIITTHSQFFSPHFLLQYGRKLGYVENGAYLGIPLILLAAFFSIRFRNNRWLLFCAGMSLITFVLSLGPHLSVVTRRTTIPLPFALLGKIPLLNDMLPDRLSMYVSFFVALVVACGVSDLRDALSLRPASPNRLHSRSRPTSYVTLATVSVLGVLSALALIPRWPYYAKTSNIPDFFTTSAVMQIPNESVVLTYPFPYYPENQAMMWQATSAMRFKEVGTYALIPNSAGGVAVRPPVLPPGSVEAYLTAAESGSGGRQLTQPPLDGQLVADLRQYLRIYDISTVVVDPSDPALKGVPAAMALFVDTLGRPEAKGGVNVWFDVPSLIRTAGGSSESPR